MSTNYHEIFKSKEDHFKWDNHIAHLQSVDLLDTEKEQVASAINYLRNVLGEDFLEKSFEKGHPFWLYYLINHAPWVWLSLLRFSNILKSFETLPNFEDLIGRIKSANERNGFVEAHSVVEVAHKFTKAGFEVLIDVEVEVTDKHKNKNIKKPDIKLTEPESNEEIYVEVTKLGSSQRQILSQKCHGVIWDLLHDAMNCEQGSKVNYQNGTFYLPYSRLLRDLEEDELEELIIQLKEFIESVKINKEFQEFYYKEGV